ncbi:vWA domain-containing protein [Planctomicrobium piriforme]|uniref:von Willebrand factor type A domain-containing protein n=1 Tax=Planctomicrobium piriforme TaxID=1576369 RepID=A0A1I3LZ28_9PLAN|nr:vWA domain-containing protein [Planctomicrobium piriforme]SFI89972.1 von Willebrand factor type A domain-containing protein [Planctomicrobium piriforme]
MSVTDIPEEAVESAALPRGWLPSLSLAGSLMVHLSLMGLLAAAVLPGLSGGEGTGINVGSFDTVLGDGPNLEPSIELSGGFESSGAAGTGSEEMLLDSSIGETDSSSAAPRIDESFPVLLASTGLPGQTLTQSVGTGLSGKAGGNGTGTGTGAGTGTGDGNGKGGGGGNGGRRKFFNIETKGKSAVFVVDASRSMNMPHPGPMHTRFNRVKLELLRTIAGMTEEEQFFIVFFGDGAIPMPARALVNADPATQKKYLGWMARVPAEGHTFPQQALMIALTLQPDAIYFLTDGEFDYAVVPGVTAANVHGVPIHTIGFSDNRAENLLQEIAQKNNGTYTYISSEEDEAGLIQDAGDKAASIISGLGN